MATTHLILFTLEGCGPCLRLKQQGVPEQLRQAARDNMFRFAHYNKSSQGAYTPPNAPEMVKKTGSFPELCVVTADSAGHVQSVDQSLTGTADIQRYLCWLNDRAHGPWTSGYVCRT